jgi:hypothetical protein
MILARVAATKPLETKKGLCQQKSSSSAFSGQGGAVHFSSLCSGRRFDQDVRVRIDTPLRDKDSGDTRRSHI